MKIVHHTTEGATAAGAITAFQANRSDPHFTVDRTTIYQHINSNVAARALRNDPGGVQTNRDGAVQIEVVGFAGRPKDRATLENVARLCRWIEETHSIPRIWPNGHPKPAVNGHDPGGHNRNAQNWDTKAGHYGHCHVPENFHWDPAYSEEEVIFLMEAEFNAAGLLVNAGQLSTIASLQPQTFSASMVGAPMLELGLPRRSRRTPVAAKAPPKVAKKKRRGG